MIKSLSLDSPVKNPLYVEFPSITKIDFTVQQKLAVVQFKRSAYGQAFLPTSFIVAHGMVITPTIGKFLL
jgi:hypothetical protein